MSKVKERKAVKEPKAPSSRSESGTGALSPVTAPASVRPGRNEPCHCGSGRKYKHCCLQKDDIAAAAARTKAAAKAEAEAAAQSPEAAASAPKKAPKPQTHQPWKATTSRGFVPKTRTPRKVGGG